MAVRRDVPVRISPNRRAAKAIGGLAARLAVLAGVEPASLASHDGFREAVRRARSVHPAPVGPQAILLVRGPDGTVSGLEAKDDGIVLAIAHGYETFEGRVEAYVASAFASELRRLAGAGANATRAPWLGVPPARPMRLHDDPARDAELRAGSAAAVESMSATIVRGGPDDGFEVAKAWRHPVTGDTRIVALAGREPMRLVGCVLEGRASERLAGKPGRVPDAALVAALLASGEGRTSPGDADITLGVFEAGEAISRGDAYAAVLRPDGATAREGRAATYRASRMATSMARQARAISRRADGRFVLELGLDVADLKHALHGGATMSRRAGDMHAATFRAWYLLDVVDGTTAEDRRRIRQGAMLSPLVSSSLAGSANWRPVRDGLVAGIPLRRVHDAALGWDGSRPGSGKALSTLARFPAYLALAYMDAVRDLYVADPGRPPLTMTEFKAIQGFMSELDPGSWGSITPAVVAALRGASGRIVTARRRISPIQDVARWLSTTATEVLSAHRGRWADNRLMACMVMEEVLLPHGRRFGGLEALSARWHARIEAYLSDVDAFHMAARKARGLPAPDEGAVFPHLLAGETRRAGVAIRPLVGSADLRAEGREMSHCVGTYVTAAMGGGSMIVALRSGAGRSTAELRLESTDGRHRVSVRQHQGIRNGTVPAGHAEALREAIREASGHDGALDALAARVGAATAFVERSRSSLRLEAAEEAALAEVRYAHLMQYLPPGTAPAPGGGVGVRAGDPARARPHAPRRGRHGGGDPVLTGAPNRGRPRRRGPRPPRTGPRSPARRWPSSRSHGRSCA